MTLDLNSLLWWLDESMPPPVQGMTHAWALILAILGLTALGVILWAIAPRGNLEPRDLKLGNRLGGGILSDVYLSRCCGVPVAVKVMRHSSDKEQERKRRKIFEKEAQLLEEINGDGFLPILHNKDLSSGDPRLVLEYVPGDTLSASIKEGGPLVDPHVVGPILQSTAAGLSAMHRRQYIHRDITPSNVMRSQRQASIIDLGLGKDLAADATATYSADGTLRYLAPERARGDRGTTETDVFGWGVTVAFALTGRTIWPPGTLEDMLVAAAAPKTDPAFFDALDEVAATGPWHNCLAALLRDCVAGDPLKRPKDGDDLLDASVTLNRILPATGHTQQTFDRAAAKMTMRAVATRHWQDDHSVEHHLVDVFGRMLRLHPASSLLRSGVASSILHGLFMGPNGHLAGHLTESRRNSFKSPGAWQEVLGSGGIAVDRNRNGLLVFP